jgi:hypothetical protein
MFASAMVRVAPAILRLRGPMLEMRRASASLSGARGTCAAGPAGGHGCPSRTSRFTSARSTITSRNVRGAADGSGSASRSRAQAASLAAVASSTGGADGGVTSTRSVTRLPSRNAPAATIPTRRNDHGGFCMRPASATAAPVEEPRDVSSTALGRANDAADLAGPARGSCRPDTTANRRDRIARALAAQAALLMAAPTRARPCSSRGVHGKPQLMRR